LALLGSAGSLLFNDLFNANAQTFRVPFETHSSLIFLRVTLDKQPALLLLDTGSNVSFTFKTGAGLEMNGDHFRTTEEYPSRVVFRYPEQIKMAAGIVGQDVLRQFKALRIDYKASVIEFEKGGAQ